MLKPSIQRKYGAQGLPAQRPPANDPDVIDITLARRRDEAAEKNRERREAAFFAGKAMEGALPPTEYRQGRLKQRGREGQIHLVRVVVNP